MLRLQKKRSGAQVKKRRRSRRILFIFILFELCLSWHFTIRILSLYIAHIYKILTTILECLLSSFMWPNFITYKLGHSTCKAEMVEGLAGQGQECYNITT